ncbi:hypothetical protein [Pseudactinotalea sp.]|uniref:hypothetical protein n=1 Tax=Pseudactinotalea sp. TaxID=1926260 RepID=UPI003B3B3BB3
MDVVALVGVLLSFAAAGLAAWQARQARQSAWQVASLNHQIAALDRETDQFRDDLRNAFTALGALRTEGDMVALVASLSLLQSSPRATAGVVKAGEELVAAMSGAFASPPKSTSKSATVSLQAEARKVFKSIAEEKARLVTARDLQRRWPWSRSTGNG